MKKGQLIFSILSLLGLASCDPYGGYEYWIQNESDSSILVSYSLIDKDTLMSENLTPGQEFRIVQFETNNGLNDTGIDDLFEFCDSLSINFGMIDPVAIKKSLASRDNWTYRTMQTSSLVNAGENIYTFTIKNEDVK